MLGSEVRHTSSVHLYCTDLPIVYTCTVTVLTNCVHLNMDSEANSVICTTVLYIMYRQTRERKQRTILLQESVADLQDTIAALTNAKVTFRIRIILN